MGPRPQPLGVSVSQINQLCVDLGLPRPQSVIDNIEAGASHRIHKLIFTDESRWQDLKIPYILALYVSLFELIALASGVNDMKTESDVSKVSYTTLKITVRAESRSRFRNEIACAIFCGNYSEIAPRVYLYRYGVDGPLRASWVLMDFYNGTSLESQLPGLKPVKQYVIAELLISLVQKSHRSRLPASGRI